MEMTSATWPDEELPASDDDGLGAFSAEHTRVCICNQGLICTGHTQEQIKRHECACVPRELPCASVSVYSGDLHLPCHLWVHHCCLSLLHAHPSAQRPGTEFASQLPIPMAAVFRIPVPATLSEVPAVATEPDDFMDVEEASAGQPAAEATTATATVPSAMTFGAIDDVLCARCVHANAVWGNVIVADSHASERMNTITLAAIGSKKPRRRAR